MDSVPPPSKRNSNCVLHCERALVAPAAFCRPRVLHIDCRAHPDLSPRAGAAMFGAILLLMLSLSLVPYIIFQALCSFQFKPQDLKKKYGASWAVVTGASSGTPAGRCRKPCAQKR